MREEKELLVAAIMEPGRIWSCADGWDSCGPIVPLALRRRQCAPPSENLRSAVVGKAAAIRYDKGPGVAAETSWAGLASVIPVSAVFSGWLQKYQLAQRKNEDPPF